MNPDGTHGTCATRRRAMGPWAAGLNWSDYASNVKPKGTLTEEDFEIFNVAQSSPKA